MVSGKGVTGGRGEGKDDLQQSVSCVKEQVSFRPLAEKPCSLLCDSLSVMREKRKSVDILLLDERATSNDGVARAVVIHRAVAARGREISFVGGSVEGG